jgi:ribosome biogenesis GTPase
VQPFIEGLIIDGSRGIYQVQTPSGVLLCTIRGKLRKELAYPMSESGHKSVKQVKVKVHDPVAVGDRVGVLPTGGNGGVIETIIARAGGAFTRRDPSASNGNLTSIAGLDRMVLVFAARDPHPNMRVLDRFLVTAESQQVPAVICLNKCDLGIAPWLTERMGVYATLGYPVVATSAATAEGLEALRQLIAGRTSALLGPSGVGKSSLLNALEPGLAQRVSAISDFTGKGRHTTTGTRLCPLSGPAGGYIADTAGIRELALNDDAHAQLDWCFVEFRPLLGTCHLADCTHLHEPRCAIQTALAAGGIDAQRYESYRRLRTGGEREAEEDWGIVE